MEFFYGLWNTAVLLISWKTSLLVLLKTFTLNCFCFCRLKHTGGSLVLPEEKKTESNNSHGHRRNFLSPETDAVFY